MQERIKQDIRDAMRRKDKEVLNLLRTVLGEMDRIGKDLSNKQIDKIIRNMHSNAVALDNEREQEILNEYLLPEMSELEIEIAVRQIVTMNALKGIQDLGKVMFEFDKRFSNKPHDKKIVASTARKWLLK